MTPEDLAIILYRMKMQQLCGNGISCSKDWPKDFGWVATRVKQSWIGLAEQLLERFEIKERPPRRARGNTTTPRRRNPATGPLTTKAPSQ